jgi:hypothetical protein
VDLHWGSATGPVLRTKVVTASGSGFVRVLIPESTTEGKHSLWAIGDRGTMVRVTVTTFAAAEEPTATPTTTLTATPTMSVVPSETPTETVTGTPAEPTATVTVDPSSATPTEVATDTATSVPTETATESAATNTPVATETLIPDGDEPTVANSGMT